MATHETPSTFPLSGCQVVTTPYSMAPTLPAWYFQSAQHHSALDQVDWAVAALTLAGWGALQARQSFAASAGGHHRHLAHPWLAGGLAVMHAAVRPF